MKTKTLSISILRVFIIFSLFILAACDPAIKKFNQKIKNAAIDEIVDSIELNNLNMYGRELDNETVMNILSSDSLIESHIREVVKNPDLIIEIHKKDTIPELGKIRFYIETSKSMGGYLNGGTNLQDVVNLLIGELTNGFSTIRFVPNTFDTEIRHYQDKNSYTNDLVNGILKIGGHSPLYDAFRIILDSSKSNDINFFVTDGIMSGSDTQVANDPDFNKNNRTNLLTSVLGVFEQVKQSYGLSVYAFYSKFNSISSKNYVYFDYRNTKINKNFNIRPFYIFVFGNKDLMPQITEFISKQNEFVNPVKELHFGFEAPVITKYVAFKSHEKGTSSKCMIRENQSIQCNKEPSDSDPIHFAIGLNLKQLPGYARELSYLNKNSQLHFSDNLIVEKRSFDSVSLDLITQLDRAVEQKKVLNNGCTHYIDIDVNNLFSKQDIINLQIKKIEDKWYEEWSCDDDSQIANNLDLQKQTLNFKFLILGIREAFKTDENQNFVDIKVKINK